LICHRAGCDTQGWFGDLTMARIFQILVVCTGNECRSPATERMLGQRLVTSRESRFELDSAGTAVIGGAPLHRLTATALRAQGVPVDGHLSRPLSLNRIVAADLVLTAERAHRVDVAAMASDWVTRTFTIAEFARLCEPALRAGAVNPRELVAAAASLRGQLRLGDPGADDIPDPIAKGLEAHLQVVEILQRHVRQIADVLGVFPQAPIRCVRQGKRGLASRRFFTGKE
jgi:protein-tyrosine phosphatase